jgi:hypothetical protein
MEERAIEEEQQGKARDKVRAELARAAKVAGQLASDEDLSDVPPHMLGR